MRRPQLATLILLPLLTVALAGCVNTPSTHDLSVTVTDSGCQLSETSVPAGTLKVSVSNETGTRTGVALYARSDLGRYSKQMGQTNVDGSAESEFEADAGPSTYQLACQPRGQVEQRTTLVTTGTGHPEDHPKQSPAASTDVTLTLDSISPMDVDNLRSGQVLKVTIDNQTDAVQSVYAAAPNGERLAGVEGIVAGETASFNVKLIISGGWTLYAESGSLHLPPLTRGFYVGG